MRRLKDYARMFWYGAWRGLMIGAAYSAIATVIAALASSAGLSSNQATWSGIVISQVTFVAFGLHSRRLRKHHDIVRGQAQSRLAEQLAKLFVK